MNITQLKNKIDTFYCEIDNAYGAIVCIREAAKNSNDEAFSCFSAELYSIEHYLMLLVNILDKETSEFNQSINELNIQRFNKYLQRVLELFVENVSNAPCDENTCFLHRKSIGAAFAAYGIVRSVSGDFLLIMNEAA